MWAQCGAWQALELCSATTGNAPRTEFCFRVLGVNQVKPILMATTEGLTGTGFCQYFDYCLMAFGHLVLTLSQRWQITHYRPYIGKELYSQVISCVSYLWARTGVPVSHIQM
ncbi:hypothetical protein XELAEV_18011785mg [Xenopus laevis]|uniref:Uncharacterized protein n=1 Tax=Xenopus laevis TaxID=8355 RepID=A0A974DLI3_XENLA|nr:hypothetical protein XELAEV_18011785mg [Xenopus laevis]